MRNISVVIIDNHPFYREGIKRVLEGELGLRVVVEGDDSISIIDTIQTHLPSLLLIDVNIMKEQRIDVKKDILNHSPKTKIVVIAFDQEGKYVTNVIKKGVNGFLLKDMNILEFSKSIEAILDGMYQVDSKVNHYIIEDYLSIIKDLGMDSEDNRDRIKRPLHIYTARECEVLQLLSNGNSNRAIAEALDISEKTVKNHVSSIFKKMKVNDRTKAVVTAIKNKWVEI